MNLPSALCLAALVLPSFADTPPASGEQLRIGVAEADITPPLGFPMAGYYHERLATGTHDPLRARAVVFRGNGEQAALVVCDLTGIAADLSTEIRRRASEKTGIPAAYIAVSATHSHTAPDYTRDLYEHLAEGGKSRERYAAKLIDGAVEAVVRAYATSRPAVVEAGSARQETPVSFNRRFVMKDGSVRTWMRLDQPDVVRAAGPIDPEVGVALVRSAADRRPLALLSNFALHLDTVGGTLWSADYPYYIEQSVREVLGKDLVSVFGTGCCGDINHVDRSRRERNKTDFIGGALGRTVVGGLGHLRPVGQPTLRVRGATVRVPLRDVTPEQAARARPLLLEARSGKKVDFEEQVIAYRSVVLDQLRNKSPTLKGSDLINWGLTHTWAGVGTHLPVEVQVISLGEDLALVFLPGEIFVDLGLAIQRASPFRTTLVVELTNCVETMYVPTRAAYAGGSYEVTNSALEPGSGEMLVEAAVRLLREVATVNRPARKPLP
jgi:hypothetical protein